MIRAYFNKFKQALLSDITKKLDILQSESLSNSAPYQHVLNSSYQVLYQSGVEKPDFNSFGFRSYSQHEEDGLIWYIFSLIGATNKRCVEACAGNGIECNLANLIINHGWIGLLLDGEPGNIKTARNFYHKHPNTKFWPPEIQQAWITKDNINALIENAGFSGEVDLFSLDIDGIDYYLWKELAVINPRLVVLEFNHLWGPHKSVSVPYREDFKAEFTQYGSDYAGASLAAFVKLAKEKGYRLIGTNRIATNAFFLRNDIEHTWLPEVDAESCFGHPRAKFGMEKRFPLIKDKEWVEI